MKTNKRVVSFLLTLSMVITMIPMTVFAESISQCTHIHTEECGYVAAQNAVACQHLQEDGTYSCAAENASEQNEQYECIHNDGCGYAEAVQEQLCNHVHDENCGGLVQPVSNKENEPGHLETCEYESAFDAWNCYDIENCMCQLCIETRADQLNQVMPLGVSLVTDLDSLNTALANGNDIQLTSDINLSSASSASITIDKPVTIDLNGKRISMMNVSVFIVTGGGILTITDSAIGGGGSVYASVNTYPTIALVSTGSLILNSGTIENENNTTNIGRGYAIGVRDTNATGTITIAGGTVKADVTKSDYAINGTYDFTETNVKVKITGGTLIGKINTINTAVSGTTSIGAFMIRHFVNGGPVPNKLIIEGTLSGSSINFDATGMGNGVVIGSTTSYYPWELYSGVVVGYGATGAGSNGGYQITDADFTQLHLVNVSGKAIELTRNGNEVQFVKPGGAAVVTGSGVTPTTHSSITAAITAATSGNTIQLLDDSVEIVTIDKDLTLDINGHSMKVYGAYKNMPMHLIDVTNGKLTIEDSAPNYVSATITPTSSATNFNKIMDYDSNDSSLIAKNGVITLNGGSLELKSGMIYIASSPSSKGINHMTSAGSITISGGIILSKGGPGIYNGSTDNTTAITVSGGRLMGSQIINNAGNGTISISGITVSGNNSSAGLINNSSGSATILISDVNMNLVGSGYGVYKSGGSGTITLSGVGISHTGYGKGIYSSGGSGTIIASGTSITTSDSNAYGVDNVSNTDIIISGSTISSIATAKPTLQNPAGSTISNRGSGTITLSNSTVTSGNFYGIYNASTGAINLLSGTVKGATNSAIYNNEKGTVNVSGGVVTTDATTYSAIHNATASSITYISGGSIKSINNAAGGTLKTGAGGADVELYTFKVNDTTSETAIDSFALLNAYSYGINDVRTDNAGKLYFWLPKTGVTLTSASAVVSGTTYSGIIFNKSATLTITPPSISVLTYNLNGGTGTPPASQSGITLTVAGITSDMLAPVNKVFDKWNTVAAGTGDNYSSGSGIVLTQDTTLYATYRAIATGDITITGGSIVDVGQQIQLTAVLPKTANGGTALWASDNVAIASVTSSGAVTGVTTGTAIINVTLGGISKTHSVTVNAQPYTVTFNANGGTGGTLPTTVTQASIGAAVTIPSPSVANCGTKEGYTLDTTKWATVANGTTYINAGSYTPTANVTLYAVWTVNNPGGNTGGGGGSTITVPQKIKDAPSGGTVAVPMSGSSKLTTDILTAAKGKNVDVVLNYGKYTWTINGETISSQYNANGYDLTVKEITQNDIKNLVENNKNEVIQLEITYSGSLPFTGKLTYPLDESYNGKTVNLYYFNEKTGKLEYRSSGIVKDGKFSFDFTHASKYVLTTERLDNTDTVVANPFTDVNDRDWFYEAVMAVVEEGLFSGIETDRFGPQSPMTRAMFATVLARLEGSDLSNCTVSPFTDVNLDSWYGKSVTWAAQNGILTGYGNGTFGPNNSITREEMATMMYNYLKFKGEGFTGTWAFKLPYGDTDKIASWAYEGVSYMTMKEIMKGNYNNFNPKATASRAEVAQIFYNYLNSLAE